jgi:hypothetical protein
MPGLEDYYYNEYMRNLPGTSTPSPYEAQRQYYKKMLHQYFDERGIDVLPLDVGPNYNANVKNYLDINPVIHYDDIAGHMGYLKRLPNKEDFEFTTRDIWKFTPDDYHFKWAGSSNKDELFKQLQVEAMDAFGKPIVLTQTNPIKFKNGGSMELEFTPKQIKDKINKHAFSGGQETLELQRQLGANLNIDVSYEWLSFFLESDERLAEIGREYSSGAMLTGEVKKELIGVLTELVTAHQERRKNVTEEVLKQYMSLRNLEF